MLSVVKKFSFSAAHFLPNYEGDCKNLHGHTWKGEVEIEGYINNETGMIIDFKEVKKELRKIEDLFDHKLLNDIMCNPTCEHLVYFIVDEMKRKYSKLVRVRLYESDDSYCEWKK